MSLTEVDRLLQLSKHHDKDERFMATNDMITVLDGLDNLDRAFQSRITDAILCQLDDQSADVQSVAVKCLSVIVAKFSLDQIVMISQRLCELIFVGNPELRDIYSIGVRTIINSIPSNSSHKFCATLSPILLAGIRSRSGSHGSALPQLLPRAVSNAPLTLEIQMICIELLRDLLKQFGEEVAEYHEPFLNQLLTLLSADCEFVLQKRVVNAMAALAPALSPDLFEKMFSAIIAQIERFDSISGAYLYNYIQCFAAICRVSASAVSPWIPRVVPFLIQFSSPQSLSLVARPDATDDIRETCLQAMESIFRCCWADASSYHTDMLTACYQLARFDPNFVMEMGADRSDEGEAMVVVGDDSDGDWDDDSIMDDVGDDDDSFKVRKSALLALNAFVANTRREHVHAHFPNLIKTLFECFGDRDVTVRIQALSTFVQLLRTCGDEFDGATFAMTLPLLANVLSHEKEEELLFKCFDIIQAIIDIERISAAHLLSLVNLLLSLPYRTAGPLNVRHAITSCFRALLSRLLFDPNFAIALHGEFAASLSQIAQFSLNQVHGDSAPLRSKAIDVCGLIALLLLASDGGPGPGVDRDLLVQIYNAIRSQLQLQDVDQRIKDSSIRAIAVIVSRFRNALEPESVADVFAVIDSRMNNEVTRSSALDAFIQLAERCPPLDLGVLSSASSLERLCQILRRKSPTSLRHQAARAFSSCCFSGRLSVADLDQIRPCLTTFASYIDDHDSHLGDLILSGLLALVQFVQKAAGGGAGAMLDAFIDADDFLSRCGGLLQNCSLPHTTLDSLLFLLQELAVFSSSVSRFSKRALLERALATTCSVYSASVIKHQSSLIAALACSQPEQDDPQPAHIVVEQVLMPNLLDVSVSENHRVRALQAIGKIGKRMNLTGIAQLQERLIQALDDKSERCKMAASVALGKLGARSSAAVLPRLFKELETSEAHRYAILNSFKEMLICLSPAPIPLPDHLLPLLMTFANSNDEGVRNLVSHCLGLLCTTPEIKQMIVAGLKSPSPNVRSVMIGTLRYIPSYLDLLEDFVDLLSDDDISTRRHALMTMNALLRDSNQQALLAQVPGHVLPHVVLQTEVDASLIRTLDFGPFKQKIDEGIPLRRAAFCCLESLAANHPAMIEDYPEMHLVLARGLTDEPEVQLTVYHILLALCSKIPDYLLSLLPSLVPNFMNNLKDQLRLVKTDSTYEASMTILRTAMRLFVAIKNRVPKAMSCQYFREFIIRIEKTAQLTELMKNASLESTS